MATPSAPAPQVSPFDAARDAFERTRRVLFPVRFEKWLALGFLAFLDQCGRTTGSGFPAHWGTRGGGGPALPGPRTGGAGDFGPPARAALAWMSDHSAALVLGGLLGLIIVAGVTALFTWLNARGTFMYIDAVVAGRVEIGRAWRQHAAQADSYFAWSFGIALGMLAVAGIGLALLGAMVVAFAQGRLTPMTAGLALAPLLPVFLLLGLALPLLALAGLALRDFVAPLQLAAGVPCGEAVRILEALLVAHPGAFVLYLALKLALRVVTGVVIVLGGCFTCCLALLPVVMQTVFQPLFFFERSWSVSLLRRMGHDIRPPAP